MVCAMVRSEGGIGLLPMPNDGLITSKTQMSIEVVGASNTQPLDHSGLPVVGSSLDMVLKQPSMRHRRRSATSVGLSPFSSLSWL